MTKNELIAKRAKAWEACKNFLDTHETMTAEDEATYERMNAEIDECTKAIDRIDSLEGKGFVLSQPTTKPLTSAPSAKGDKRTSDEYRAQFENFLRNRPSNTYGDLQEGTSSEGGYLVPVEFEKTLVKGLEKTDPIFALAHHITMGAHEKNVPIVADEGDAALISEEGAYGADGDSFTQKVFKAYKFGRIVKASDELIADSAFDIESYVNGSLARSIGRAEAGYFWTGTGSSQPEGVMSGSAAVTTATQGTLVADEIIDLYFALPEQYRAGASWVFSNTALKLVRKLKDSNGQYIWQPGFGNEPSTILGSPVRTSDNIDAVGNGKKVGVFGNFDFYWIGDRQGVEVKRLNELYAGNGQVGFRGSARSDGHVMISDAFKILAMHA